MDKKIFEKEYTRKELAELFGEENKRGRSGNKQMERWKREYDIQKIEGTRKYTIKPLSSYDKVINRNYKNVTFQDLIQSMIYEYCANSPYQMIALTNVEAQLFTGLVNSRFFSKEKYSYGIMKQFNITSESDIYKFKKEINSINNETCNRVFKSMVKQGMILQDDCYKVVFKNSPDKTDILTTGAKGSVYAYQNKISIELYGLPFVKIQRDKNKKEKVIEETCKHFGFISYYPAKLFYFDKDCIKFQLSNLYDRMDFRQMINDNNSLRISKSRSGELKNICKENKAKLTNALIEMESETRHLSLDELGYYDNEYKDFSEYYETI
jgi:hypothetical protein